MKYSELYFKLQFYGTVAGYIILALWVIGFILFVNLPKICDFIDKIRRGKHE